MDHQFLHLIIAPLGLAGKTPMSILPILDFVTYRRGPLSLIVIGKPLQLIVM
jgi:hypothetical protein